MTTEQQLAKLDAAEADVNNAIAELSALRQKYQAELSAAERKVSLAQAKLSSLMSVIRDLMKAEGGAR